MHRGVPGSGSSPSPDDAFRPALDHVSRISSSQVSALLTYMVLLGRDGQDSVTVSQILLCVSQGRVLAARLSRCASGAEAVPSQLPAHKFRGRPS